LHLKSFFLFKPIMHEALKYLKTPESKGNLPLILSLELFFNMH